MIDASSVDIYDNGAWSHIDNKILLLKCKFGGRVSKDTPIIGSLGQHFRYFIFDGVSWTTHLSPGMFMMVNSG
ncbi:MAG: hypothetical protein IPN88_04620 [Bacteroidetes bacterium]|nr:hypothetical protein [Bacteroidota bacterium]